MGGGLKPEEPQSWLVHANLLERKWTETQSCGKESPRQVLKLTTQPQMNNSKQLETLCYNLFNKNKAKVFKQHVEKVLAAPASAAVS